MTTNMTSIISGTKAVESERVTPTFTGGNETDAVDVPASRSDSIYLGEIIYPFILVLSIPGIIGNAIVIGRLCFRIKRQSFHLYILNLALADSGTLLWLFLSTFLFINDWYDLETISECLICIYCSGRFFLIIVSLERCLALLSPIWYQCHQPQYLPTILCAITWIVSFLISAIHYTMRFFMWSPLIFDIVICGSVCVPLMVVSSMALFIKASLKPQMQQREQFLLTILLVLLLFVIFFIPVSTVYLFDVLYMWRYFNLIACAYLFVCLNSSVNPLIYFLLGRERRNIHLCPT